MNNVPVTTPAMLVRTINIIHMALLAGPAMFALVTFSISELTTVKFDQGDPFLFIVPLMAVAAFFVSNFLFKTLLKKAINAADLRGKLSNYQIAIIVRMALIESVMLFGIVTYNLTGNFLFLLITMVLIVYGVVIRPTIEGIADDLQLSYDEKMQLKS